MYVLTVIPPLVVEELSIGLLSLNHTTAGIGSPPDTLHDNVTVSPNMIFCGELISGIPGGAAIKIYNMNKLVKRYFYYYHYHFIFIIIIIIIIKGRRGRDRMVVRVTTKVMSSNIDQGDVYNIM